jgi:hypothetical protein
MGWGVASNTKSRRSSANAAEALSYMVARDPRGVVARTGYICWSDEDSRRRVSLSDAS